MQLCAYGDSILLFPSQTVPMTPRVPGWVAKDWTKRCVRQADHILVAANFNGQGRGDVPQKLDLNCGESQRIGELWRYVCLMRFKQCAYLFVCLFACLFVCVCVCVVGASQHCGRV